MQETAPFKRIPLDALFGPTLSQMTLTTNNNQTGCAGQLLAQYAAMSPASCNHCAGDKMHPFKSCHSGGLGVEFSPSPKHIKKHHLAIFAEFSQKNTENSSHLFLTFLASGSRHRQAQKLVAAREQNMASVDWVS